MSEKLKTKRLDIYPGDVKKISECSQATASRRINQCRDALGKEAHQLLTIKEYCQYFGYEYEDVLTVLGLFK